MQNFWDNLKRPILALAPMADVTDLVFREMFSRCGKPDVMFTEFVSVDGLCSAGQKNLLREFRFTQNQHPIVAQIWGTDPKKFRESAELIASLGFDGIDINMGCPQRKEIAHGACAALIQNPQLAQEIIAATKQGGGGLPVSVKTRLGYNTLETARWVTDLLAAEPVAITLHARTKNEMSKAPAHWDEIARAVKVRDNLGSKTLILGNGDIRSREEGLARVAETGCDGAMIGRGAFGNPWLFDPHYSVNDMRVIRRSPDDSRDGGGHVSNHPTVETRLQIMLEHAKLFETEFQGSKNFAVMRKHFKAYVSGFDGASELRVELMTACDSIEVEKIVEQFLSRQKTITPPQSVMTEKVVV